MTWSLVDVEWLAWSLLDINCLSLSMVDVNNACPCHWLTKTPIILVISEQRHLLTLSLINTDMVWPIYLLTWTLVKMVIGWQRHFTKLTYCLNWTLARFGHWPEEMLLDLDTGWLGQHLTLTLFELLWTGHWLIQALRYWFDRNVVDLNTCCYWYWWAWTVNLDICWPKHWPAWSLVDLPADLDTSWPWRSPEWTLVDIHVGWPNTCRPGHWSVWSLVELNTGWIKQ